MPIIVNVHEAKTQFSRLLEQAHAGQEIILAKAGKPYARLVPLEPRKGRRRAGRLKGVLDPSFFDSLPDDELAHWDGEV